MKKTAIIAFSAFAIISCNNKEKTTQNTEIKQDSIKKPQEQVVTTASSGAVKMSSFKEVQEKINLKSDTVYITNYWATWCPPCRAEIPDFVKLQEKYKNQKVKITFVSLDDMKDHDSKVVPFVQANKMKNVVHIEPKELLEIKSIDKKLGDGIPITLIQKGDKKESRVGNMDEAELNKLITKYLN